MHLLEFAHTILKSSSLHDKLLSITEVDCFDTGIGSQSFQLPEVPARKPNMKFAPRSGRVSFPKRKSLHDPTQRAKALHYFANHELSAIEILAWALLRYPEAPLGLKMSLLKTLSDEQTHFKLYWDRMRELSVDFGDFPVNDYFWQLAMQTNSALEFVTTLGLMLETANLDFADEFFHLFKKIGDEATSQIMHTILIDEIQHVHRGVHWFNELRNPDQSAWDSYVAALPWPAHPSRAKGFTFVRKHREAAGLAQEIIEGIFYAQKPEGIPQKNEVKRGEVK